ncbi:MAG: hypothetical protein Q8O64_11185 [Sideroxyarcus sp.]|nr:hypothetical protein [Sideroxyarcus sp.]
MTNKIALVEFEKIINSQSSTDVAVPYSQVANAFPSDDPHPYSFDEKLIAKEKLFQWGKENGWEIKAAPELQDNDRPFAFPVRFIKIT